MVERTISRETVDATTISPGVGERAIRGDQRDTITRGRRRRGGGGPSRADIARQAAAEKQARDKIIADRQRALAFQRSRNLAKVQAEQRRIKDLKVKLKARGAATRTQTSRNVSTGNIIRTTTTGNAKGERIFTRTDTHTGATTTRVFAKPRDKRKGRGIQQTGGLITTPTKVSSKDKLFSKLESQSMSTRKDPSLGQRIESSSLSLSSAPGRITRDIFGRVERSTLGRKTKDIFGKVRKSKLGGEVFDTIGQIGSYKGDVAGTAIFDPRVFSEVTSKGLEKVGLKSDKKRLELGFALALPTTSFPKEIVKPLRAVRKPTFNEISATKVKGGRARQGGVFEIVGESRPPMVKIKGKDVLSILDDKFKSVTITPAKTFNIQTPRFAEQGKPFQVLKTESGRKGGTLSELSGDAREVNLKTIRDLSPTETFAFQRLAEKQLGTPVSKKVLSSLFKKDAKLFSSEILQTNLGKVSRGKGGLKTTPPSKLTKGSTKDIFKPSKPLGYGPTGKTTERSLAATEVKTILETEKLEFLSSTTVFKDIGKPLARASGKTPSLTGNIIRIKEPIILDGTPTNFGTRSTLSGGRGTPLSQTFKQQTVSLPKPTLKTPKTPKVKVTTSELSSAKLSPVVGFKSTSIFDTSSGSQAFTETSSGPLSFTGLSIQGPTPTSRDSLSINTGALVGKNSFSTLKSLPASTSALSSKGATKHLTKGLTKELTKGSTKELTKGSTKGLTKEISKGALKQQQKLLTKQQLKQTFKQPSRSPMPRPRFTRPTKKPPQPPPPPLFKFPSAKGKFKKPKGLFGVEVRRFGKFKSLGAGLSLNKALAVGRERVASGLGATFKVTGGRKGTNFGSLKAPKGFRTKVDKKAGLVFIEKRKFRLSRAGEIGEIQTARRSKF